LSYLSFAHPAHFTVLRSGTTLNPVCHSLDSVAVACVDEGSDGDGEPTFNHMSLIPLNGGAPTKTTVHPYDEYPSVVGRTMIWNSGTHLSSISLGHPSVVTGAAGAPELRDLSFGGNDPFEDLHQFSLPMVSALGQVALMHDSGNQLVLAKSAAKTTPLLTAPHSTTSVAEFALTSGRVVYVDDQRRPHSSGGKFSSYSATITGSGNGLTVATPKLLHGATDNHHVGASKSVSVYALGTQHAYSKLEIVYRGKIHTIAHVVYNSYLQVSGNRVMFAQNFNDGITSVYNAKTGKTVSLQTGAACCDTSRGTSLGTTPAISGDVVSYMKGDGSIWSRNLSTHKDVQLSKPVAKARGAAVYAAGKYVGWSITYGPINHYRQIDAYRNVQAMSKAVAVNDPIEGLSSSGVLLGTKSLAFDDGVTSAFSLRSFAGKTVKLLPRHEYAAMPQLVGSTLAWLDARGRLKVRSVS
jgi:hypothetical protein